MIADLGVEVISVVIDDGGIDDDEEDDVDCWSLGNEENDIM